MSEIPEIGSRELAVKLPNILSVGAYIARKFPQMIPDSSGKTIYHYTTSDGLVGILQNSGIWASNYAFLNDPSEKIYCLSKTVEAMERVQQRRSEVVKALFVELRNRLHGEGLWTEYIASFCEEGDLLSQWRAYGANTSGYAIGFEATKLGLNLAQTASLVKVIYDPGLQLNILVEVCEVISDFVENELRDRGDVVEKELDFYADHCAQPIWSLCCKIKHNAYSEEKEWRLVFLKSAKNDGVKKLFDEDIGFRTRGTAIVPYVNIPFGEPRNIRNGDQHYPISRIIIGPTENSGVAKRGVELLCESVKKEIVVSMSSIPARQF